MAKPIQPQPMKDSRSADKFVLRLPDGMRELVARAGKAHKRSMNAEIVQRMQDSLMADGYYGEELQAAFLAEHKPTIDLAQLATAEPEKYVWCPRVGDLVESHEGDITGDIVSFHVAEGKIYARVSYIMSAAQQGKPEVEGFEIYPECHLQPVRLILG